MSKDYSPFCRVSAPQTSCQRPLAPLATCQPILQLLIHSCGATLCARRTRLPLPAHMWWGSSSGGFAVSLSLLCWAIMARCFLCILVRLKKKKKKTYRVHLGSINICCSWQGTEIALRQNQDAQGWRAVGLEWAMYGKKATYSGKGVAYLSCSAIQLPVFSSVNPNTWDKEGK